MGLYQDSKQLTDGSVSVALEDGSGTPITSTLLSGKQAVDVNVANSISIMSGVADKTIYVYGASGFQPVGGVFQDTSPTLTAGQSGSVRLTAQRGMHMNLRTSAGAELGDSNADGLFVKLGDGTNAATVNASNELLVRDTTLSAKLSPSTAAITSIARSNASQVALALNTARKGFVMTNDSGAVCYVAFAGTATNALYTYRMQANSEIEPNFGSYTGAISVIWGSNGAGNLVITELT